MTNEFKRTPTHGENDVDLRVATEPRRVTDAVLSQIIATKDGEIAALTAEVTHLAEKLAERDASVFGGVAPQVKLWDSQWVNIVNHADCYRDMSKEDAVHLAVKLTEERMKTNYAEAGVAPQPVDAAQAVPELTIQSVTEKIKEWFPDRAGQARFFAAVLFGAPIRAIDEFEAEELRKSGAQPTDTTKDAP